MPRVKSRLRRLEDFAEWQFKISEWVEENHPDLDNYHIAARKMVEITKVSLRQERARLERIKAEAHS
jgi:hypothetical protein